MEHPERYIAASAANDLKHTMHMIAPLYDETYLYVLSEGRALAEELFRVAPGRSLAVTLYPGSTCSHDGFTLINSSVSDTLQKLSVEKPVLDEDWACPIFMFGESDMRGMRNRVTWNESRVMYQFSEPWLF